MAWTARLVECVGLWQGALVNVNEWIKAKRAKAKPVRTWNGSTQAPTIRRGRIIFAPTDFTASPLPGLREAIAEDLERDKFKDVASNMGRAFGELAEQLRRAWEDDDKRGGQLF